MLVELFEIDLLVKMVLKMEWLLKVFEVGVQVGENYFLSFMFVKKYVRLLLCVGELLLDL